MPNFKCKAKKGVNEIVKGVISADNKTEVINKLVEQGLFPVEVEAESKEVLQKTASKKTSFFEYFSGKLVVRKINSREMFVFTRKLATLTRAKMELLPSLRILYNQENNPYFKEVLLEICNRIKEGKSSRINEATDRANSTKNCAKRNLAQV
ncbi:MAG: type II secretion system F family protein [Candidatus Omnitrophota bacterium]